MVIYLSTQGMEHETGKLMYNLTKDLFPICRSITGNGVRDTLKILQTIIPLKIIEIPTGKKVFDWTIPKEWNIRDAYILDTEGNKIVDFKKNNLHVVGYSIPIDTVLSLDELQKHLFSIEEQPEAIPYVTSYYKENWGFCISHNQRQTLKKGFYKVYIDSELKQGHLTYGELILPGKTTKEIFLSTYICHPSLANNELSGPVLTAFLAKWIQSLPREFTYRIIFIPETIGSIAYLSENLYSMKQNIVAGFNITCVADNKDYSFLPSRYGNTLADKVAQHVLKWRQPNYKTYSFLERGSDERQYCSPGIDLPVVSIMRTKYTEYPEYHTSLDNLDFISSEGFEGAFNIYKECIKILEKNAFYKTTVLGEPQLGKRGLYPSTSIKRSSDSVRTILNFLTYADGTNDLIDIADFIRLPALELIPIVDKLIYHELISKIF
nr:DUF4910 domain-containing protein [Neobacillus sp. Marseille-Q6967]